MTENIESFDDLDDPEIIEELENIESGELYEHFRFVADPGQGLLRIDKFLVNRILNASRSKIQEAAEAGNIRVNDISVKPNYRIKPFDVITIVMTYHRAKLKSSHRIFRLKLFMRTKYWLSSIKNPAWWFTPAMVITAAPL